MPFRDDSFWTKFAISAASTLILMLVGFFVWLSTLARDIVVLQNDILANKESRIEERRLNEAANVRVQQSQKETTDRVEAERAANDKRVADDLHELRNKVFK